jgi:hypothetical protein
MLIHGQLRKAQLENLAADPANTTGAVYYNTGTNLPKFRTNAAWDTFVGLAATQTLTGKTLDAGSNTITNLADANLAAGAAIARSKIAVGSNDHVLINTGAGALSSEAQLAITRGGTAGGTALAGFNNLSPVTTKGDLITRDGTNNIRLGVGANTHVLTADSAETSGIKWAALPTEIVVAGRFTTNAALSVPSTVDTFVEFEDVDDNTGITVTAGAGYSSVTGLWATPPKHEVTEPGHYLITASLTFSPFTGIPNSMVIKIYVNGVARAAFVTVCALVSGNWAASVSAVIALADNDDVQISIFQNTGSNQTLVAVGANNHVSITRISA